MGQPLTGNSVESTYVGLLKTSSNAQLPSGSMEAVSDGLGNDSALELGQSQARLKGEYVEVSNTTQTAAIIIDENVGDKVNYVGEQDFSAATVTGLPDTNTTYNIESVQDGANIDIKLVGSDTSVSTVQLNAGTNITLTQNVDGITIDAAGGGGAAGLVAGTATDSMRSSDSLTTTPAVAQTQGSIVLGNGASDNNLSPLGKNVIIGDNAKSTGGEWTVVVGKDSQNNRGEAVLVGPGNTNNGGYGSIMVGRANLAQGDNGITIGVSNNNYAQQSIIIGVGNDNSDYSRVKAILIGNTVRGAQRAIVIGNDCPNYAGADAIQIGNNHIATQSNYGVNIGYSNDITGYSDNVIVIGQNNASNSIIGAAIIGNGITAVRANTLHTNGLNVGTVDEYADNATAVSAGLPIGQVYRTGDLLKIVHA